MFYMSYLDFPNSGPVSEMFAYQRGAAMMFYLSCQPVLESLYAINFPPLLGSMVVR
jgi:hypothetical protein